jgi:predicted NACHT family NTPase
MARRSLRASAQGIQRFKAEMKRKKWTQTYVSGAAQCSRQTVWSLLAGKAIDADIFLQICALLGLEADAVAEPEDEEASPGKETDIDELVRQVRETLQPFLKSTFGEMKVLDMSQPIGLGDIYTDVNILQKPTGSRRVSQTELLEQYKLEEFEGSGSSKQQKERVPGLQAVEQFPRLVVLGKPGAGKTTFLKRITTQCITGQIFPQQVPVFVTLKQFTETKQQPDLFDYIAQQWSENGVDDADSVAEKLLNQGRILLLLDGLDEVRQTDSTRVVDDIRRFSERFHRNQFIVTCRIAAKEFTLELFTEVEVADFDDQQIAVFVTKWFALKDPTKTERFLQQFKKNPRVQPLAKNPLLLTLLCWWFEDSGDFSANRSELYEAGIFVLLKKWDAKRNIERDQVYKGLSLKRKEDMLSQIALNTFKTGNYFFKQKDLERQIREFIESLAGASTDEQDLELDSAAVLKSIEAQHGLLVERAWGIYSFSHLTFQEYFTARKIAASCNPYSAEDGTLQMLAQRVTDKRWREVFLLMAEILPSADNLLQCMKKQIDSSISKDDPLQQFLGWAQQKTCSVNAPYNSAAVRASYMSLALKRLAHNHTINLTRALDLKLNLDLDRVRARASNPNLDLDFTPELTRIDLELDQFLSQALRRSEAIIATLNSPDLPQPYAQTLSQSLNCAQTCALDPKFNNTLKGLKAQLPNPEENFSVFIEWWNTQGQIWVDTFRAAMKEYRNIPDLPFTYSENKLLEYLEANLLLVNCLNSSCYVTRSVREEIEDTLLLPIAEIEKRRS